MELEIKNLLVVLGSPNDSHGNLSDIARGRTELAFKRWTEFSRRSCRLLLTGGFGDHFNITEKPHAYYAQQHLIELGISEDSFLEFAESVNTVDDALKSKSIVERYKVGRMIVVSSDFHLERVQFIFENVFKGREIEYQGALYLESVSADEKVRLVEHELKELESLKEKGVSVVGGSLSIYTR